MSTPTPGFHDTASAIISMVDNIYNMAGNPLPQQVYSNSIPVDGNGGDVESAAQNACFASKKFRRRELYKVKDAGGAGGPPKDDSDVFTERPDPAALKEHLLNMANQHRAEMAFKRAKPTLAQEGNAEIGNGYGVACGGAYYRSSRPGLDSESEQKPSNKELPEYLKQKLRAGAILKDDTEKSHPTVDDNKSETGSTQPFETQNLPPGWVEAKDPSSGASYYYNESTGKSHWESPAETSLSTQTPSACLFQMIG